MEKSVLGVFEGDPQICGKVTYKYYSLPRSHTGPRSRFISCLHMSNANYVIERRRFFMGYRVCKKKGVDLYDAQICFDEKICTVLLRNVLNKAVDITFVFYDRS